MKLTGAQIVIETLLEQGADTVFGYPGGSVLNIYDELYKASDRIRHITTCHEQGACHAADAYARTSGKTGVVIATSGPGATNLVTGIANAYLDSTPLVAVTGNVSCELLGRDSFQEVDICGITMPVTKHNFIVKDVNLLADTIRRAFLIAESGRPGPVLIDIPKNVQADTADFEPSEPVVPQQATSYSEADLKDALSLIKTSKKPFIYTGGGVMISGASKELAEFAEKIDAPVGSSMMALGAMDAENERFLGMTGMHGKYIANKVMYESDLIIAIGTRFSDRATGSKKDFSAGRKFIHIDIDPAEIGKNISAKVSLIGDVKEILGTLIKNIGELGKNSWNGYIAAEKAKPEYCLDMDKTKLNPQSVIETVNKYADPGTVIATDVGQHQMWTAQYYKFSKPHTFMTSGGLGTMGFGMGAAIGAAVASGHKTVLFTSDGSFHMNMNEMATAVSHSLPLLIVVLNNNALGMVRQWQNLFYGERYSNTSLARKTDYVKLAEAFGMGARRVDDIKELDEAVRKAMALEKPYLLEMIIDSNQMVLPMIPSGGTMKDIILKG